MMNKSNKYRCFLAASCAAAMCFSLPVGAQDVTNPDRNKPLEITAEESLEWHRSEQFFQAKKDVKAVQGATTLYCDDMVAKYRDSEKSNIDIYRIEATGKVRIVSADSKAYGDKAVYNMDKGYAEMTGKNLRLVSKDQNVSARDKFVYWAAQGRLEAIGKAVAVREGDKIEADKLIATFSESKDGKRELETLEGVGHVVITMPEEVITGAHAHYSAKSGVAVMNDNVRVVRGESFLEGASAQVDLNTNISKIYGSKTSLGESADVGEVTTTEEISDTGKKRVRAVFYPKNMEAMQ
jgi:lipopolysaccharide export system protein LptA